MKTQKILFVIAALAVVAACKNDKQAELIQLKKQRQELNAQIAELEIALASDTSGVKTADAGVKVSVAEIVAKPFAHYIEVQGKLDGEENVALFPKGQGIVSKVYAKVGERVAKGQVLAQLDDAAYIKSLDQTRAQYALAKEMYERQSRLWEQKIGSEMQYLQAKTQKEALESALAGLEEQIDFMKIKSPISGTLEDFPVKVGQAVSPAMPVATVINFASLKVVADVAEGYGASVAAGDSVAVFFPDLKNELAGAITSASKYISPINRSFKVEVRFAGTDPRFKANMIAVLRIADYKKASAVSLPVNLIQTDAKGNFVYVAEAEGGKYVARKKYVEQGMSYNGVIEVTSGVSVGDKVVTGGHLGLDEGVMVRF